MRGEEILVAAGRAPSVAGLNLEGVGIAIGDNGVKVDEYLETTAKERLRLRRRYRQAPLHPRRRAPEPHRPLQRPLSPSNSKVDYDAFPWTTFTDPEVARVGLTEQQAREQHDDVKVFPVSLRPTSTGPSATARRRASSKLVTDKRGGILGAPHHRPRRRELHRRGRARHAQRHLSRRALPDRPRLPNSVRDHQEGRRQLLPREACLHRTQPEAPRRALLAAPQVSSSPVQKLGAEAVRLAAFRWGRPCGCRPVARVTR